MHHPARFGNVPVDPPKVVLEIHKRLTQLSADLLTRDKVWRIAAKPEFLGTQSCRLGAPALSCPESESFGPNKKSRPVRVMQNPCSNPGRTESAMSLGNAPFRLHSPV